MYGCMHTCMQMRTYIHAHTHTHRYTHMHTHVHTNIPAREGYTCTIALSVPLVHCQFSFPPLSPSWRPTNAHSSNIQGCLLAWESARIACLHPSQFQLFPCSPVHPFHFFPWAVICSAAKMCQHARCEPWQNDIVETNYNDYLHVVRCTWTFS